MTEGKKAYYQVSFTGGQALTAVVVLIVALGVSFFLGAKAGFEKSGEPDGGARPAAAPPPAPAPTPSAAATETSAPAVSEGPSSSSEEAPVFEDREAGVTETPKGPAPASPSTAPSRTDLATPPKTSAAPAPTSRPPASSVEAPKTASETPHKGGSAAGFYVQVVSTSSHAEANRWKEKLAAKKYRTAAVSSVESAKGKLWRVRIGPYPDRAQASKAAAKIDTEFRQKAWVAPE